MSDFVIFSANVSRISIAFFIPIRSAPGAAQTGESALVNAAGDVAEISPRLDGQFPQRFLRGPWIISTAGNEQEIVLLLRVREQISCQIA